MEEEAGSAEEKEAKRTASEIVCRGDIRKINDGLVEWKGSGDRQRSRTRWR